jgi:hypothetical protein
MDKSAGGGGLVDGWQRVEDRVVPVRRGDWDRVLLRQRRLRTLLVECGRFLLAPGPPERQLERRTELYRRIVELTRE